jgi:hypothetical protein
VHEYTATDWTQAEAELQRSDFRSCPDCQRLMYEPAEERVRYCDVHRCAAITKAGTRCKNVVSENPMYCTSHACTADWTEAGGTKIVRCADSGTIRVIPDGRRVRVCDTHHQMMWAGTQHEH